MTRAKWLALCALALLQAADALSTRAALRVPGIVELNPLVRYLGLWPAKVIVLAAAAIVLWRTRKPSRMVAVCGYYCLVVMSNLWVAR